MTTGSLFGEVIFSYSRAQAIEDGVLVDLSNVAGEVCRQHFKHPVACTSAVYDIIERAINNKRHCNDLNGIVHDVLTMAKLAVVARADDRARMFQCIIKGAGRTSKFVFKIVCGPGDDAEPVLTIMFPNED